MPQLEDLQSCFPRERVEVLAINLSEPEAKVIEHVRRRKSSLTTLLDPGHVAKRYAVTSLPAFLAISADGRLIHEAPEGANVASLSRHIEEALAAALTTP